jgi:NAD(P)-dependent dehydrogenase (short-subunit alcohol dehydrogenase family)
MTRSDLEQRLDFSGATVAITGAAGGFGREIALLVGGQRGRVIALDKDETGARATVAAAHERGAKDDSFAMALDVRDQPGVQEVFDEIGRRAGSISTLINSAGVREIRNAVEISAAEWTNVIAINLSGTFFTCQAAARLMIASEPDFGRSIVNIASVAGLIGVSHRPAYTASKHGVVGLTKNLAKDLAAHGIRANVIAPGTIRTPMTETYYHDEEFVHGLGAMVPLGAGGSPADVAYAALYLASPLASFITGAVLPVDGGWLAEKGYAIPGADSAYLAANATLADPS